MLVRNIYRILFGIFLVSMLSTCANVMRYEKGALVAYGQKLDGSHEPLYYLMFLDLNKSIDSDTMNVLLKLSVNAPPIAIKEIHPDLVASYLPPYIPPSQWPKKLKQQALEDEIYSGGGFNIRFKHGKLQSIGICSHCSEGRQIPVVGTPKGIFYTLPLTEKQVIEVFGIPNRLFKVSEVRY